MEARKARAAHEQEPGSFFLPGLTIHDDAGRSLEIARFFDSPMFCVTYRYEVLRSKVGLIARHPEAVESQVPQLADAHVRSVLAVHFQGDHGAVLRELRRFQPAPDEPPF